jgi:branched-chain amino acid transport system ATP-binding protein
MPSILTLEKIRSASAPSSSPTTSTSRSAVASARHSSGRTGAGKTTLFGINPRQRSRPTPARVVLEGHDVNPHEALSTAAASVWRARSRFPQPFGGMTVFENLVVGRGVRGGRSERDGLLPAAAGLLEQLRPVRQGQPRAGSP